MDFPVTEAFIATANAGQLHDEARGTAKNWPASFTLVDGQWVYRVDLDDLAPADAAKVADAIAAHTPDPSYGVPAETLALRAMAAKSTFTTAELVAAVKAILQRS